MDHGSSWQNLIDIKTERKPALNSNVCYKHHSKRGRAQSPEGEFVREEKRPCYDLKGNYRERIYDQNSNSGNLRNVKTEPSDLHKNQQIKSARKSNLELLLELKKKDLQKLLLTALTTRGRAFLDSVSFPNGSACTVRNVIKNIANANCLTYVSTGMQPKGPKYCNLFVTNLPSNFSDVELATLFMRFGSVLSAKVCPPELHSVYNSCYGFINFRSLQASQEAMEVMNFFYLDGHIIRVYINRNDH